MIALAVMACLALCGCEQAEKDELHPALTFKIEFPQKMPASAERAADQGPAKTQPTRRGVVNEPISLPAANVYHVRIQISNPDATYFIFNYVPGTYESMPV